MSPETVLLHAAIMRDNRITTLAAFSARLDQRRARLVAYARYLAALVPLGDE